jgi:aryl-alcohol dehydrogenase-like predicted oxidoreductase
VKPDVTGEGGATYKTRLRTSPLGATGLEITRVGFGAWAIGGGGWEFGWGPQPDDASIAAIHRALELGINWVDTAAAYGFGRSERVLGQALAGLAERPYVFTKWSLPDDGTGRVRHSLKRDSVLREAEASLLRLGGDAIDLYQIHWPDPEPDIAEGWAALAELKEQGLVRQSRHLALAARLAAVADRHGVSPGAVAVAWVLRNPAVDGAITGFRRPEQVDPVVAAAGLDLTSEDLAQIEASG